MSFKPNFENEHLAAIFLNKFISSFAFLNNLQTAVLIKEKK